MRLKRSVTPPPGAADRLDLDVLEPAEAVDVRDRCPHGPNRQGLTGPHLNQLEDRRIGRHAVLDQELNGLDWTTRRTDSRAIARARVPSSR